MTRIILFSLCCVTFVAHLASAQNKPDTLYTVQQELPLPPNDSGGRWLSSALILTSSSAYPQHVKISTLIAYDTSYLFSNQYPLHILADSAYYLADSIHTNKSLSSWASPQPWKYLDSVYDVAELDFLLAAHSTMRIPIRIRAITKQGPPGDTNADPWQIASYSDSAAIQRIWIRVLQVHCLKMYGGLYAAWQTELPSNDSGGRWLHSSVTVKSLSAQPIRFMILANDGTTNHHDYSSGFDTLWQTADSGYYLADSIYVWSNLNNTYHQYGSVEPWKYLDTIHSLSKYFVDFNARLFFTLPAHGTLRLPIDVRAAGRPGDTLGSEFNTYGFFPTSLPPVWFTMKCPAACAGPFIVYNGEPLSNKQQPAVYGSGRSVTFSGQQPYGKVREKTHVTLQMRGEYSQQFVFPAESDLTESPRDGLVAFLGAPKSLIHDTLIASYTDCWGTTTTSTPIEAYSYIANGYRIRPVAYQFNAPFLGSTSGNVAVVENTSDFPITLRNVHGGGNDSLDFVISAPSIIAAHGSGYISATLRDKDVYLDTLDYTRGTTITGIVAPFADQPNFQDSTFSLSVGGRINVYSPLYYSDCPELKQGIHPTGIIFTSSVKSLAGPHTFLTVYGNNDLMTEYFGVPYYDDPHFTLQIGNFDGFGSIGLPGYVKPDTSTALPPTDQIQVLTTFTGDSYHNYLTQLHWPREHDTITIDVLALGTDAPPFMDVPSSNHLSDLAIWPNPANNTLYVQLNSDRFSFSIFDALGRVVRREELWPNAASIDVSKLPPGTYELYVPEDRRTERFQILR